MEEVIETETMAEDVPITILLEKLQKLLLVLGEGRFIFPRLANRVDIAVKELKQILSFILHAENNTSSSSSRLQEARLRLLPTLDSAEYIIETFLLKTQQRRQKGTTSNLLIKTPLMVFPSPPWTQIQFNYKMKKIVKSFRVVSSELLADHHPPPENKYETLCDPIFTQASALAIRRHQYDHDQQLVGHGDAEKELVAQLTNNYEKSLRVISLVSEEALGKTALAWKVYNRLDIRQHFQYRAWLHVPTDFAYKDLLLTIFKQIPICVLADVELMSENELSALLFQTLMELRFLVVLDDVRAVDVWLKFVRTFGDAANGSRVILTTRDSKVASDVDPWSRPLKLVPLTDEESWALFLKKVVVGRPKNSTNYDTDQFNNFRVKILRICRGLPPTIILLGGLLSTIELSEWSNVIDHLSEYMGEDDQSLDLSTIVALSYHKLPYVLRPCFLYLTLFPKAYEIPTRRLLQLWIAEGFVQTSTTAASVPEDMAKTYLKGTSAQKHD